jgi:hypothetical protein
MRFPVLAAILATALSAASVADAQRGRGHGRHGHDRDQDAAFHAMQQGQILPLSVILSRVRVRGARYLGADLDPSGSVYRLSFMRGGDVIRVHVDARTGRPLGTSR